MAATNQKLFNALQHTYILQLLRIYDQHCHLLKSVLKSEVYTSVLLPDDYTEAREGRVVYKVALNIIGERSSCFCL